MTKIDDMIRDALAEKDQAILDQTPDLGWFALGLSQFHGPLGWVTWVIMILQIVLFATGVWCAINFFSANETLVALKWGLPGAVLILMAAMLKFTLMPQMQADRVIREVKRLELMIASRGLSPVCRLD